MLMDHVALHKQLRMKTTLEPIGLIPGTNIYRPADLLPVPYLNDVKALGLDICVTTAVSEHAASGKVDVRKPLWAAETKEKDKKKDDAKKLQSLQLTERDVDYIKTPLVYETTGGSGRRQRSDSSFGALGSFASTQSPPSGRREQARTEGLAGGKRRRHRKREGR